MVIYRYISDIDVLRRIHCKHMSLLNEKSYVFINTFHLILFCIHACVHIYMHIYIYIYIMESQKATNSLDNTTNQPSKCTTKNRVEMMN